MRGVRGCNWQSQALSAAPSPDDSKAGDSKEVAKGTNWSYDANGNTLTDAQGRSFSWDFENRLIEAVVPGTNGGTTTFKYDPFGRRIQKSGPLGTTNYLYDGKDVVEEVDSAGSVAGRYTQGPGVDRPLSEFHSSTADYYDADGLGSITSLTDASGTTAATYAYGAFGNLSTSTGSLTNPFRYTGREFDSETGLGFYRARYYDPGVGRFLREDPIQFLGGANFYAYARNNPILNADPSGLYTEVVFWNPVGNGESSQGHISIIINGTSYSWGPGPGNAVANKCCKAGEMDIETPASNYLARNTRFRTGLGYVLNLTTDQESALANYLSHFHGNYNLGWRNCGDPLISGLAQLGIYLDFDLGPLWLPPLITTPGNLEDALNNTPGLVNGWVPHPQDPKPTKP